MSFWMTPQRIYDELTTGPGSETLQTAQGISREESAAEQARAQRIRRLMSTIDSGWQGSAADGAHGAARPLAQHAAEGAEYLYLAQDLLDRQAGSFHRAAASVEPMPPDPAAELLDQVVPFEVDTDAQAREYQQKAQHNIRVFEGYDNASNHNETNLPQQFTSTNHTGGGISVTPGDTIEVGDSPRNAGPGDTSRYQGPVDGTAPSGYRATTGSYPSAAGPAPGVTGPASGPAGYDGWGGSSGGHQATGSGGSSGVGGLGAVGGPGNRGGAFGPGAPGRSRGPGGPGGSGRPGGPGWAGNPGNAGDPGNPGRPGGAGGPGVLRGPMQGPGALAAEEAAARRAAAGGTAAGRGGTTPFGAPMPGGKNNEDDEEHKRKVLMEADPEDTFGSDVLTAPQVIGDDEYEDD